MKFRLLPVLLIFLLTSCNPNPKQNIEGMEQKTPTLTTISLVPTGESLNLTSGTDPELVDLTTTPPLVEVTSTPDTRLPPEQWKEWPVVPEPTSRVYEIYQLGIELGNDPHHFSKIGDCHSVKAAFMGLFDQPGWYKLNEDTANLQDSIDWFAGSFNRDGQGVKGGYNAAAVLSPLWADPAECLPGENPVQCEVRVHKPTFAIISLEVWWDGRTPERYEAYMREILDYLIEHGVVPILATKADNVEGDHSLNYTTAKLAYEYDLPLWNFWLAVQDLPYNGMDMERNDGFHISYQAWTTRSYSALKTLDRMWRSVNEE